MKNLNIYIHEAWSGMKQHSLKLEIGAWCDEMGIQNYTINDKGEIDVDGSVNLNKSNFKELPYKFRTIKGYFSLRECKNLISLKNCPDFVGGVFSCSLCRKLDSLEGCPEEVGSDFYCRGCKREFTKEEVQKHCNTKNKIYL